MNEVLVGLLSSGFVLSVVAVAVPLWRGGTQLEGQREQIGLSRRGDAGFDLAARELSQIEAEYATGLVSQDEYLQDLRKSKAKLQRLRRRQEVWDSTLTRAVELRLDVLKSGARAPQSSHYEFQSQGSSEHQSGPNLRGSKSRKGSLLWVIGFLSILVITGVVVLVSSERSGSTQAPVARVLLPDYRTLATFGGRAFDGLILGHESGIHTSVDGGKTWSRRRTETSVNSVAVLPGVVYIAADGLFTSKDLEADWIDISPPSSSGEFVAVAIDPSDVKVVAAVDNNGAIFLSFDAGGTWDLLPVQAPRSTKSIAIMSPRDLIYLGTTDQGVIAGNGREPWASANGFVNGALPTVHARSIIYDAFSGDSFEGVNGRFEGALYVGTDLGIFRSLDGGSSWNLLGLDAVVTAITVDRSVSNIITAVDERGRIFRSSDKGFSWTFGVR